MRRAVLTAFAVLTILLAPTVASAQSGDPIADAAAGLKGHTVYLAPNSGQNMSDADVQRLEGEIAKSRAAIFIAVLPESAASAAGGVDGLPHTLAIAMGDPTAVVGVVSGRSFRAGSKAGAGLDSGEAGNFAKAAVTAHSPAKEPLVAALSDWVSRVNSRVSARPTSTGGGSTSSAATKGSSTDWGKVILIILAVGLVVPAIIIGIWLLVRKRRQESELARRRSVLKRRLEDVSGDVVNLESTVAINDNAKAAYSNAVTAYTSGNSRFSDTASDLELDDVEHYIEIAESAMADAKEYAAGRDPHPVQRVSVSRVASLRPKQTYAKEDAPKAAPTQTTTVVNNYNGDSRSRWQGNYDGYGYGYYPGFGWGYYGNNGDFVAGMLAAEMMEDRREERYEREEREDRRDDEPSYSSSSSSSSSSDSGSGDWGSSSSSDSSPSIDFGGGGDWGGGGGDSGGGGGGGGDW